MSRRSYFIEPWTFWKVLISCIILVLGYMHYLENGL